MLLSPSQNPDLIAGFYEAAAQAEGWSGAWSALCTAFDAETGLLYRQARPSAPPTILAARNWPQASHGLPADRYVPFDTDGGDVVPRLARSFIGQDLAAPRNAAIAAVDPEAAFPTAAFHAMCATLPIDGTALVGMGLHRPVEAPRFTHADRQALDSVGRHVAAALRLEALLASERMTSALRGAALDLHPHGVLITAGDGSLLFANDAARRIAEACGIALGRGRAGIGLLNPDEATRLEALITSAAGGGQGGWTRITRRNAPAVLVATVDPLPVRLAKHAGLSWPEGAESDHPARNAMALITLRDLGATADASPSQLMDLFGLTAAEAGIVPQLLAGDSASLIAQSRGVAQSTVKSQTARILAKTGAANLRALSTMLSVLGCC
jgi:DNA-binding CsgD family transcriptional regulator/GAF domain-containing protein